MADEALGIEAYALVTAGLADGLPLEELLEHLELDGRRWRAAERVWRLRVLEDIGANGTLALELDRHQRLARAKWARPIPPLDSDLRAWIDFQRNLASDPDPAATLRNIPLCPSDLGSLAELWSRRFETDPDLRAVLEDVARQPPRPVAVPAPARPILVKRALDDGHGTGFLVTLPEDGTLPFAEAVAAPMPPPLSVPLPRVPHRAPARDPDVTAAPRSGAAPPSMPFARASSAPDAEPDPTNETSLGVPVFREAALPFEETPAGLPPSPNVEETALGVAAFREPALPFQASSEPVIFPDTMPEPEEDPSGGTLLAVPVLTDAVLPFAGKRPALSLAQHAVLSLEIAFRPERALETLGRYGITTAQKRELDAYYRAAVAGDDRLRAAWHEAYSARERELRARGSR